MNNRQQGFMMVLVIIGLVLVTLMFGAYFAKNSETQKSQYDAGQEGIQQVKEINQKSYEQSQQIQEQLEMQNEVNANY
jgi:outer membrane lipoprotein-sorting protein